MKLLLGIAIGLLIVYIVSRNVVIEHLYDDEEGVDPAFHIDEDSFLFVPDDVLLGGSNVY